MMLIIMIPIMHVLMTMASTMVLSMLHDLNPKGPSTLIESNYIPQTIFTIPYTETIDTLYAGTLHPSGKDLLGCC